jgi:hypothetical protein
MKNEEICNLWKEFFHEYIKYFKFNIKREKKI